MREIKFRCYDKNEGYMLPWEHLVQAGDLPEMLLHGHEEDADYSKLMQFTGLKDKNGAEIYEGDVIDCNGGFGEVIMDIPAGQWSTKQVFGQMNIVEPLWHWYEDYAVLGNIYENPELLDNKK